MIIEKNESKISRFHVKKCYTYGYETDISYPNLFEIENGHLNDWPYDFFGLFLSENVIICGIIFPPLFYVLPSLTVAILLQKVK